VTVRGRATRLALPALIVVVLVAIVAVAATGSVSRGSSTTRAPSRTLLDTFFTLSLLAVVAGAILLVYGLFQRKEIARQMASGRYPRFTLVGFLAFVVLVTAVVSLFKRPWDPSNATEDGGLGGRDFVPSNPGDTEPVDRYEPHLSWITIVALIGLLVAAGVAYVISARRARRERDPRAELAQDLAGALDDALDDLRSEADPRRAIIAAYARLERVLAASGIARHAFETSDEYLVRVLQDLELRPGAISRLTELFTQAKFSHHDVDSTMKESAIEALGEVRHELRALNERPATPESGVPRAATT
jgi:uncharacterized protein DUF4129